MFSSRVKKIMEITKNLQNTGALPTDVDTQTNTPENEIEIIEAESSDDENQINSPGRNYLTSGDEFSDFGSDDSIIDKDPSSSDSDENPHNLFDDTIEGNRYFQHNVCFCCFSFIFFIFHPGSAAEADDFDSNTADENEANDTTDDGNGNMPHVGLDTNNWQDIVEGQVPFNVCNESAELNFDVSQILSPLDAYKLFVTDEFGISLLKRQIDTPNKA
ncbi:unnamed protein product [Acanthoscelides obtectus]|uniref:Uncharacterized protein n=1 Tax=Acanthoscelides obtectus TaxID=200917 RepID=A0A9P0PL86_ACAOB|nr:unnamed protein product [Acanthoscelides obtectus]CAK1651689.1 hypothetical protein AOBTE_LOCUS17391 [Acanthoscelides obtectus]